MPDGKPNLTGVYNGIFPGTFFPGGPTMNSAGVPGPRETKPVLKPGAEKFKVVRGPTDTGLSSDCMPLGVPQSLFIPYQFRHHRIQRQNRTARRLPAYRSFACRRAFSPYEWGHSRV